MLVFILHTTSVWASSLPTGKWSYGRFSPTSFWSTDGSYKGAANEQAMALHVQANGTFEMYVLNSATYYNCRTSSYTYWKGTMQPGNQTFTLTPQQGTYRGEYSCYPGKNFKRPANNQEIAAAQKQYRYAWEKDREGRTALRIFFGADDQQGALFTPGHW
ncbi:hypothetical protein [Siphonobacter sp. BAB-5405]|nr:hypothetical protein [Siphonobacter sp. BAB-5405]